MRTIPVFALLLCAGLLLQCGMIATADPAQITSGQFLFVSEGQSVATAITLNGLSEYVWAGAYRIAWALADPVPPGQYAFCTDPSHNVTNGYRTTADVITPLNDLTSGLPSAGYVFGDATARQSEADAVTYLTWKYLGSGVPTPQEAQAASLAIWDIVNDGGDGLAAGNFRSQASTSIALGSRTTSGLIYEAFHPTAVATNLVRWVRTADASPGNYTQDFAIVGAKVSPVSIIPEPAFFQLAALIGMGGLGIFRPRSAARPRSN